MIDRSGPEWRMLREADDLANTVDRAFDRGQFHPEEIDRLVARAQVRAMMAHNMAMPELNATLQVYVSELRKQRERAGGEL